MREDLFVFVVSFFANWGWQTLGKVPNPATGKEDKNLGMAKQVVDILEMLQEKTKGNLNEQETKVLNTTIAELQLNYVEEAKKEKKEKEEKEKTDNTEKSDKDNEKGVEKELEKESQKESHKGVEEESVEKESGEEPKKEPEKTSG